MPTELGDTERKYRKKIEEEDDLDISSLDLVDIANGGTVYKSIPVKENPTISYSREGDEGEDGPGHSSISYGLDRRYVVDLMKTWGLKFTKPGRKSGSKLEYMIGDRGSDEDSDETLNAMFERQILTGDYQRYGLQIDVKDEDLRYNIVKDKEIPDKSAYFVLIKDTSGSMQGHGEIANLAAAYIIIWLQEIYKDRVIRVYIAHANEAKEVEEKNFFKLAEAGGTSFGPAFSVLEAMTKGVAYPTETNFYKKIDVNENDLYVLQMSDGDNDDGNEQTFSKIRGIASVCTKLMYLHINEHGNPYTNFIGSLDKEKVSGAVLKPGSSRRQVELAITELLS